MANRTEDTQGPKKASIEFFSRPNGGGLPTLDVMPPYLLAHHPSRWQILGGKLVPLLSQIPLRAGCNRVEVSQDGRVKFASAQAQLQDRQFKIIPYEQAPDGETYLQVVDTLPQGASEALETYISVWEAPHAGDSRTVTDTAGYAEWLESLVAKGVLPECPTYRIEQMLGDERGTLRKMQAADARGRVLDPTRMDAIQARVGALEKALEARTKAPKKPVQTKKAKVALGD